MCIDGTMQSLRYLLLWRVLVFQCDILLHLSGVFAAPPPRSISSFSLPLIREVENYAVENLKDADPFCLFITKFLVIELHASTLEGP